MRNLVRRLAALEGHGEYFSIGELLDSLDNDPLPNDRQSHPALVKFLEGLEDA